MPLIGSHEWSQVFSSQWVGEVGLFTKKLLIIYFTERAEWGWEGTIISSHSPALSCHHVERSVVVAVREAGLDHQVLLVAGLAHPAEVAVADTLGAGPVLRTGPVQTVSCTDQKSTLGRRLRPTINRSDTNLRLLCW